MHNPHRHYKPSYDILPLLQAQNNSITQKTWQRIETQI